MEPDGLVRDAGAAKIVPVHSDKKSRDKPSKDHPSGFTHVSNPNIIPADASPKELQEISHAFDVLDLTPTCLTSETRSLSTQKAATKRENLKDSPELGFGAAPVL